MATASGSQTIVAVTGEDDRYDAIRTRASALAAGGRGTVILYDIDAAGMFASPVPTAWSGEGQKELVEDEATHDRLDADALETAGRGAIAEPGAVAALGRRRCLGLAADEEGRRRPRRVRRAPGRERRARAEGPRAAGPGRPRDRQRGHAQANEESPVRFETVEG